jgi:hypothetical protein
VRTAILIASGEAMLSLHPTTDVERKLVDIMSGEVDVSLHHTTWSGKIGGVHRQFQGLGGELIVVVKPKEEADPYPDPGAGMDDGPSETRDPLADVPGRRRVGLAVTATEGPAPLSELRQDSVGMLQLRRDAKWLEDRGVRGQVSLLPHTLAEMVGLDVNEFLTLTLKTRQKFENRAYTALRALNGGAR